MSGFADQVILRFLDNAFVTEFLTNKIGGAVLFSTAYDPVDFIPQGVTIGQVVDREFEAPTIETIRSSGKDEKIAPLSEQTMTDRSYKNFGRLVWVDVSINATLKVVAQSIVLAPESILTQDFLMQLGGAASIAELKTKLLAQYSQFQVDAIFSKLRISTIEEFKARMNLLVQFNYKAPPDFDPDDPANTKTFPLNVCLRFQPDLNISDALQNTKLCRAVRSRENNALPVVQGADVKSSSVFVTVFPDSAAVDDAIPGLTAAQIKTSVQNLFAAEGMLAHFFVT